MTDQGLKDLLRIANLHFEAKQAKLASLMEDERTLEDQSAKLRREEERHAGTRGADGATLLQEQIWLRWAAKELRTLAARRAALRADQDAARSAARHAWGRVVVIDALISRAREQK